VTFGQRWRRETHPYGGHPDGVFEIEAPDRTDACALVEAAIGFTWGELYTKEDVTLVYYPLGLLRVYDAKSGRFAEVGA